MQVVVLARVIVDQDQVTLTAKGIMLLVNKLQSADDKVLVLACSLLSSLAHTRAGIPDAMITSGAIDLLVNHLNSENDQVLPGLLFALQHAADLNPSFRFKWETHFRVCRYCRFSDARENDMVVSCFRERIHSAPFLGCFSSM